MVSKTPLHNFMLPRVFSMKKFKNMHVEILKKQTHFD